MMLSHRVFHPICHGQCAGRCSIGLRAGAAKRAGTVTRFRRSVTRGRRRAHADERAGRAQQVMRDHAHASQAQFARTAGRDMSELAVDQVGEGGLHDRVFAVGEVGSAVGRSELVKNG